jgi:hypothetical protein
MMAKPTDLPGRWCLSHTTTSWDAPRFSDLAERESHFMKTEAALSLEALPLSLEFIKMRKSKKELRWFCYDK